MSYEKPARPILKVYKPRPLVDIVTAVSFALLMNELQWVGLIIKLMNYSLRGAILHIATGPGLRIKESHMIKIEDYTRAMLDPMPASVQAQVNGNWCSTVIESLPLIPSDTSNHYVQSELQKMRILIGPLLKQPPKYPALEESGHPILSSEETNLVHSNLPFDVGTLVGKKRTYPDGLNSFVIYCTSDFITVSKKVHVRACRVRLLGFEGAEKTSLFKAIVCSDLNPKGLWKKRQKRFF